MWLYLCYSLVFAHVLSIHLTKIDTKNANESTKDIFVGVIKNISRVNNVLQELISKYEQLQKIYKSQESLDSATTDYEIDEAFKNNKEKRKRAEANTIQPVGYYPATQMILSENDQQSEEAEISSSDVEKRNKTADQQGAKSSDKSQTTVKSDDQEDLKSVKLPRRKKKPKEPAILNQEVVNPKLAEIVFVDTHQKSSSENQNKRNKASKITLHKASKVAKTRYSKVSRNRPNSHYKKKSTDKLGLRIHGTINAVSESELTINKSMINETRLDEPKTNAPENNEASKTVPKNKPQHIIENKRKVEKKLQSELFSSKGIWDDIISNKPIQLEVHNETVIQGDHKNSVELKRVSSQLSKYKTASVTVTNQNQTRHIQNDATDNSDSGEEARNDEFQANVLRKAYGDACLKLVIRKCYKACKAASKSVCRSHVCKKSYKAKFEASSKTGCLVEFDGKSDNENTQKLEDNITKMFYEKRIGHAGSSDSSGDMVDLSFLRTYDASKPGSENKKIDKASISREGYLESCLPHLQEELRAEVPQAMNFRNGTSTSSISAIGRTFNILRDKYERECKKISYDKCHNACTFAHKESCNLYPCTKDKTKAYKKACKSQCKKVYKLDRSDSSDSDSSTSHSSTSHSSTSHSSTSDSSSSD